MEWLWTWSGKSFGYKLNSSLWTHDGRHVGVFFGEEIYGTNGYYIGEIKNKNRLICNTLKKNRRRGIFTPYGRRGAFVQHVSYVSYVMYAGYEDFPEPEML